MKSWMERTDIQSRSDITRGRGTRAWGRIEANLKEDEEDENER